MANEKRLIDADALVEAIVNTPSEVAKFHTYNMLSSLAERQHEILDLIENQPTVDAVVVVRCRDCIDYNTMGCSNGFGWCEAWQQGRADESFCDCGERKDNG